jgi:hypothetical protein
MDQAALESGRTTRRYRVFASRNTIDRQKVDHSRVESRSSRFTKATQPERKYDLAKLICCELEVHMRIGV